MKRISVTLMTLLLAFSIFSILAPQVRATGTYTDFESGLGGWEPFTEAGGIVQLSTTYAHSGTYSVEQFGQSSGSEPISSVGGVRLPVTSISDQYELSTWVYVTERSDANAASLFGFAYDDEIVAWNPWGSGSSYVYVRQSEGYQMKGDWYNPVPYGLTLNTWHQVNVTVYAGSGTVSIWLDGSLIVDNWPAVNAGEKPDYYDIRCWANYYGTYVMHQYIDDAHVSEVANQPPVAHFEHRGPKTGFDRSAIYAGSEVKFDAEASYDPDGTIISYSWDFGDGSPILTETGNVSYHVYAVSGSYTVTLTVTDNEGATGEISKDIFINSLRWEIYFEIDYMTGHEPTNSVLDYIHSYFRDNGIFVYFFIGDEISPAKTSVTEDEFWQFEAMYNDAELYDDQAQDGVDTDGDTHDREYYLKEKWVLYGTVWAEDDTLHGLTNSLIARRDNPDWLGDTVAGNYIFIADQACDDYAQELASSGVTLEEVETVVLMHEIGHSMGIGISYWAWIEAEQREDWIELYDGSKWSVMHRTCPKNCNADPIRYSKRYWIQKDMGYYEI